jgi:hypothetical protein
VRSGILLLVLSTFCQQSTLDSYIHWPATAKQPIKTTIFQAMPFHEQTHYLPRLLKINHVPDLSVRAYSVVEGSDVCSPIVSKAHRIQKAHWFTSVRLYTSNWVGRAFVGVLRKTFRVLLFWRSQAVCLRSSVHSPIVGLQLGSEAPKWWSPYQQLLKSVAHSYF